MRESRDEIDGGDVQGVGTSFIPSRGRGIAANAAQAVGGSNHRCGITVNCSRGSFVAGGTRSGGSFRTPFRADDQRRVGFRDPGASPRYSGGHVATFRTVSHRLSTYRRAWPNRMEKDSPSKGINLPLLHLLVSHFGYVDQQIVKDLSAGMPIGGGVAAAGSLVARESPSILSIPEWKKGIPMRNAEAVERVEKFRATPAGAKCWEKSVKEIEAGWLKQPAPLSQELAESAQLTSRFAIIRRRADGSEKVRIIGDLRASEINKTLSMHDTAVPDNLDVFSP